MQMVVKNEGSIAVFRILPMDYHIEDRINGFLAFFKEFPKFKIILYELNGNSSAKVQRRICQRVISENNDLRGIFVPHAITHRIADYLKSQLLNEKVYLIGYDLIDQNIKSLKEGGIDFLISQQSERQGYAKTL
jgi:LacI family transcriptional regulator